MSKIAIISDIHSNKHALDLVLKDVEKRGVDKIYCLGDIVTKYYYPSEVVDRIKDNCDIVIKGNCDDLVVKNQNYKFARDRLGIDRIDYLDNLPVKKQLEINKVLVNLFHSNPKDLDSMFNPVFSDNSHTRYKDMTIPTSEYNKMFEDDKAQTSIVGHTHMDYIGLEENDEFKVKNESTTILPTDKAIINVGSVGENVTLIKENEGYNHYINPYVTYLLLDDKNMEAGFNAEIIKVPYSKELINVYMDSMKNQMSGNFPFSPNDTKRIEESLRNNGIDIKYNEDYVNTVREYNNYRKGR